MMDMMAMMRSKRSKDSQDGGQQPTSAAPGRPKPGEMKAGSPLALLIFFLMLAAGTFASILLGRAGASDGVVGGVIAATVIIALLEIFALRKANQWEKAVILRNGRFVGLKGPGLFWVVPILDELPLIIDHRVMVTPFTAERSLTKDTVPVDVDAVLFWMVWDAEKAALEVEDYRAAISWAAQTALREIIGQMDLASILVGRQAMDEELQRIIDARTTPWGITVQSVEIRDIVIPEALEDAMSRQAQAERERQARVILGESEQQIAESFRKASESYADNPTALHLRAMNMLFEGLKQKGAMVIVPSTAVDTMNLGSLGGLVSLGMSPANKAANPPADD
jgi:regulator of protease activity HflC (stomatin/prohibitin superfamily)